MPAGDHTYQVRIVDPFNNELLSPVSSPVSVTDIMSAYGTQVLTDGADRYWRLGEASGTVAYDSAGSADGAVQAGVTFGATGAINGDADKAATFGGTSTGYIGTGSSAVQAPNTFTAEAWVKTTTTAGGKIIGYGSAKTGSSGSYDRHVYMDNSGKINFGVYSGSTKTITSPTAYNDGNWHHVVASLSSAGTALYVDGRLIGRDVAVTSGASYKGYWRVGGDALGFDLAEQANQRLPGWRDRRRGCLPHRPDGRPGEQPLREERPLLDRGEWSAEWHLRHGRLQRPTGAVLAGQRGGRPGGGRL